MQNGHVESFDGRFRNECLNANWFTSLSHARQTIEHWRDDYNRTRPHSSLGYRAPIEFAALLSHAAAQPITMTEKLFHYLVSPAVTSQMVSNRKD